MRHIAGLLMIVTCVMHLLLGGGALISSKYEEFRARTDAGDLSDVAETGAAPGDVEEPRRVFLRADSVPAVLHLQMTTQTPSFRHGTSNTDRGLAGRTTGGSRGSGWSRIILRRAPRRQPAHP